MTGRARLEARSKSRNELTRNVFSFIADARNFNPPAAREGVSEQGDDDDGTEDG